MTEPTAGNWREERGRIMSDATTPSGHAEVPVADLSLAYKSSEEMAANGNLLAASKALLAAVEALFPADDWERCESLTVADAVTVELTCTRAELLALRDAARSARGS
jgi:hypothetical protein